MHADPHARIAELEEQLAQRDQRIADLEALVVKLLARIDDLERQLNRNSRNSSTPPSANPPNTCRYHTIDIRRGLPDTGR